MNVVPSESAAPFTENRGESLALQRGEDVNGENVAVPTANAPTIQNVTSTL